MTKRLVGDIYVIMDQEGNPAVACDDVDCLIQARPERSAQELNSHLDQHSEPFLASNGERVHQVQRKKLRVGAAAYMMPGHRDLQVDSKKPRLLRAGALHP